MRSVFLLALGLSVLAAPARAQLDPLGTLLPLIVKAETPLHEVDRALGLLRLLPREDVQLLRNAVFARHGYPFEDGDLASFFNTQSWYTPRPDAELPLTKVDRENVSLLEELADAFAEQEASEMPFHEFAALFPVVDLPFSLQRTPENDLALIETIGEVPPDAASPVQRFLSMHAPGRYYALAALPVPGEFVALLVKHEAFSSGYDDRYHLVTLTPDGEQIDAAQVMRYVGSDVEEAAGDIVVTPTLAVEQSWETTLLRAETGERLRTCSMAHSGQIDPAHGYLRIQEDGPPCETGDAR